MIEVRRTDYEQAARYYCAHPFGDTKAAELEKLLKRAQDEDVDALSYLFAAHRKQAEEAMRERCLAAVDNEKVDAEATGDEGDALYNRAIEDAYTSIRSIDASGEGK